MLRALVIHQPGDAGIEQRPGPEPRPGWVLIRPRLVGVCGSDLHSFTGHQPFVSYPVVPGHEVVGDLVDVGEPDPKAPVFPERRAPAGLVPGKRVTLDPAVPCGQCYPCRIGHYNVCANQQVLGVHLPGAMAELVAARADCVSIVPDHLTDELAALTEPLSIGLQACNTGRVGRGDCVGILGAGMIGLSVLLQARLRGARCAVVEPVAWRADLARTLGAEIVTSPAEADKAMRDWGEDGRPTVVVEAAGRPETLGMALDLVSPAGRVVVLGFWPGEVQVPGPAIMRGEMEVLGSRLHRGTVPAALAQLAAGVLDPRPLLGAPEPLDRGPEVLARLANGSLRVVKALLRP